MPSWPARSWHSNSSPRTRQRATADRELTRQGQASERFTRAIDQLGSSRRETQIGGIYGLEQIARQAPDNRAAVTEVLVAYLHRRAVRPVKPTGQPQELRSHAPDIQAALTVLGRRQVEADDPPLNLKVLDLSGADLTDAELSHANFFRTDLRGARLGKAHLRYADLIDADFSHATFYGTDLRDAVLLGAHGYRADFLGADLSNADFAGADLCGVRLTWAKLRDTTPGCGGCSKGADLRGVDLRDLDLSQALIGGGVPRLVQGLCGPPWRDRQPGH